MKMSDKKYWWKKDVASGDGWHFFCYDENGSYEYYIEVIDFVPLTQVAKKTLGDAKFAWGKAEGGIEYDLKPLKAKTLEEAKSEFEEIYYKMLSDRVKALNEAKRQAIEEEDSFFLYLENKKREKERPKL